MKTILLLDNYDSFTYNIAHYIESLGYDVIVLRNNDQGLYSEKYDAVVLSPGPGLPMDAGELMQVIRFYKGKKPILGICLGMQAIALELKGEMYNQELVKHGVQEEIDLKASIIFKELEATQKVGLYHSWAVRQDGDFDVTSYSKKGVVMSIENRKEKMYGVQFHPESIMTPKGLDMIKNFLQYTISI